MAEFIAEKYTAILTQLVRRHGILDIHYLTTQYEFDEEQKPLLL